MIFLKYFYILTAVIGALIMLIAMTNITPEAKCPTLLTEVIECRKSITFILGEDRTDIPYFRLATEHFAMDSSEQTDYVVTSCRTIECVIKYLNETGTKHQDPWATINLVAHGNPSTGLNLYLQDNGHKATPKRLLQAAITHSLPRLNECIIDRDTHINIWSCGIGKSPMINLAMKSILTPLGGDTAQVYCSPHFVVFHPDPLGGAPRRVKASYWPYYFKRGYRPSPSEISHAMAQQYPEVQQDWHRLQRIKNRNALNQAYTQEYHIPISYLKVFKNKTDRPQFNNIHEEEKWIQGQTAIMTQLEETGLDFDKFNWQIHKIIHTDENGNKVPAIKVIGMCTVINFLNEEA